MDRFTGLAQHLVEMLSPSTLAWFIPLVLVFLKFSIRHFINRPTAARGWVIIAGWSAFDVVFLSVTLVIGILLAKTKAGDGLATAILAIVLLGILVAAWVSFAAHHVAAHLQKRRLAWAKIQFWLSAAWIPAIVSFMLSVGLFDLR